MQTRSGRGHRIHFAPTCERAGSNHQHPRSALSGFGRTVAATRGTARHDAVAWGYARACSDMGMDIIQQCEVTGVRRDGDKVIGVDTTKGAIDCDKLGVVVAGHSGVLADMAGFRLPIESVAFRRWCLNQSNPAWMWL